MKNIFILITCLLLGSNDIIQAQTTLTGKVTDKSTGQILIGAVIYIPDLETGGATNINGEFNIINLPKSKFLIQVKYTGYIAFSEVVDLRETTTKDFSLEPSTTEIQEVVITGSAFLSDPKRTSVSLSQIDGGLLKTSPSTNIISSLANAVPGVSEISTGSGISKPVIRGLGYNRIITLSEGVRQEGQQWGDEHGIEIDQFAVDRIEILKGPGSLLYGSDALGGVINILEPHGAPLGTIRGDVSSNYSTNNNLTANSIMLEGNQKGFVWRGRGTYKNAAAYKANNERIFNSQFNETNYTGMLGVNKRWGFSHLHLSKYNANFGLIEGERDSLTNKFTDSQGNIAADAQLKSREINLPFQNVQHAKITSVNNIILGASQLKINLGYQSNNRREYEDSKDVPTLNFNLNSYTYDLKYSFPEKNKFESVVGLSGMTQENKNKGNEFLVPAYHLQDIGGFAYVKKSFEKITVNGGLRYDVRSIEIKQLLLDTNGTPAVKGDTLFHAFNTSFASFSTSAGLTYQLNKMFNFKTNFGTGWRAPNIAELGSNGVHEGTFRYEKGNKDLKAETSFQADAEVGAETKYFSASVSIFYNNINKFIYLRKTENEQVFDDGDTLDVYTYGQGNSVLKGAEASLDIHPIEQLHIENTIAFVEGTNTETNTPLPFIPAMRLKHEIKWEVKLKSKVIIDPYISFGISTYFKQDRFDIFETETKGYTLLNASLGTNIKVKNQELIVFITGTNLTDVKYYDHLSRLKNVNIYNMGRNITFGISAPFGLKKAD